MQIIENIDSQVPTAFLFNEALADIEAHDRKIEGIRRENAALRALLDSLREPA